MVFYTVFASLIFLIAGLIWDKNNWHNFAIKLINIIMAIWGIVITLILLGYVAKP